MDKLTYLAELAEGLARWVPERERQDILRYYAEYFEEAGPDREAQVVQELGDPWALSCRLAVEGGYVTQEQASSWTPRKRRRWPWMLAVGITVAVLVWTVTSIASAASQIGQVVGRFVSTTISEDVAQVQPMPGGPVTVVDEGTAYTAYERGDEIPAVYAQDSWSAMSGELEAFDSIDADIGLGNVTVVAGDDYTLYIDRSMGLSGYDLVWEVKGGTLKLRDISTGQHAQVNSWAEFKELFGQSQRMDVIVTVPEGTVLDKISVKTGLGNVMLYDVTAEKVTADTGLGNVECYGAQQVKKLDLDTGTGDIILGMEEPYEGVDIDLESGLGNIEASLGGTEQEWEYDLESGLGNVTVDGIPRGGKAERKGGLPYKLDAESGTGDVNVYFYDD